MNLNEIEIIKEIWTLIKSNDLGYSVIPKTFDDACALQIGEKFLVFTNDGVAEATDKLPGMSWRDYGWRAVISCVSDLAAKGARPLGVMISLNLTRTISAKEIREIYQGIIDCAETYSFDVWGGDLGESKEIVIDCFMVGVSNRPIWRNGVKPGDLIVISGELGLTGAAFHFLLKGGKEISNMGNIHKAAYRPEARLELGVRLSEIPGVTAAIDLSDGLSRSLYELERVNEARFVIDADKIPIAEEAIEYAEANSLDPLELALHGGEEYEILFTVSPSCEEQVIDLGKELGLKLTVIGMVERGRGVYIKTEGGLTPVKEGGWIHLRR